MRQGLKIKFLLYVSLLIVGAISVTTSVAYINSKTTINKLISEQLTQAVASTTDHIAMWMHDRKLDIASWSQENIYCTALTDSYLGRAAQESASLRLKEKRQNYMYYESLNLVNTNGQIVASSDKEMIGKIDVNDQQFFRQSLDGNVFLTSVMKSPKTGQVIFIISAPVKVNNVVTGVFYGAVDVDYFNGLFVLPVKVGKTGYIYVIDPVGVAIAHPNKENILKINVTDYDWGRKMMSQKEGFLVYVWAGVKKIVYFKTHKDLGWLVAAGAGTKEIFAPVRKLWLLNVIVTIIFISIAVVSITVLYRHIILKPIECLMNGIAGFGRGELDKPIKLETGDEFTSLAESFNDMIKNLKNSTTSIDNLNNEIAERRQAEEEMEKLNEKLKEANQELKNFVYIASHDLREPLRKISAFGSMLQKSLEGKLTDDDAENMNFMIEGSNRMTKMIEGLLAYSRVSTKAHSAEVVNLNEIVKEIGQLELSVAIEEKKAVIEVPQPLPEVEVDLVQLRQLMQNLIANGMKYQAKDNVPHITITSRPAADGMVRINVADNGIGIAPEFQQSIFVMFKRLHSRSQYEGTGIGLAVCKKIVERHSGQIGVDSEQGKGSTFWFTVPLAGKTTPAPSTDHCTSDNR